MKCSKCGRDVEDGKLFCPVCGTEIQWVPEYNTLETILQQQQIKEQEKLQQKKMHEEYLQRKKRREEQERKRRNKKRNTMIAVAGTAMILAGIGIFAIKQSQYNSFDFQLAQAESEFSNKDYESALKYLDRALSLNAESVEANILAAKIYMLKEDTDTARSILLTVIKSDPKSVSAYGELLRLYEKEENVEEIRKLMDACDVEKIKEYYSDYISVLPLVTKESGSYEELITVEFSDVEEGSKIYYTLDGSDPTADSTLYEGSIALEEGNTELRYIAYNAKGIPSETGDELYKITLKAPEPPTITPTSGEYEYYQSITVIVPEGCKAYYAFDEEPTTDSTLYTGPVDMPYNEHIFSAILVDENGKISTPASETFVMYE